jgi:hypothetical protein
MPPALLRARSVHERVRAVARRLVAPGGICGRGCLVAHTCTHVHVHVTRVVPVVPFGTIRPRTLEEPLGDSERDVTN